jgi:hypothetical protein
MKKLLLLLCMIMIPFSVSSQNVGISGDINFIPSTTFDIDGGLRIRTFNSGVITSNSTGVLSSTDGSTGQVLGSGPTWVDPKTFSWTINGNDNTSVSTNFIGTINNTGIAFRTNNVEGMRLQSSGQLTIGSTVAGGKLDVHQTSSNDVMRLVNYGNPNSILIRRTQGTQITPTATTATNTALGRFDFEGYNGTGFTPAARIEAMTDAVGGTSTDMPGRLTFSTTPDASGTMIERLRITNSGNIGIATTTPSEKLDVSGNVKLTATTTATRTNGQLQFTAGGEGVATKMVVFRKTTTLTTANTSVTKIFDDGYMRFGIWFNSAASRWVIGFSPYNNQFYDYNYLGNARYYNGTYYYSNDGLNNYVWSLSDDVTTTSGTYYECGGVLNTASWNYATGGSGMVYAEGTTTTNPFYEFTFFVTYTSTSTQRVVTVLVKAYY